MTLSSLDLCLPSSAVQGEHNFGSNQSEPYYARPTSSVSWMYSYNYVPSVLFKCFLHLCDDNDSEK